MSDDAARLARLYPSMVPTSTTESATPAARSGQSDTSAQVVAQPPAADGFGDAVHKQSHEFDMAARRYPQMAQPDGVAQAIAKAKGEPEAAPVEVIPENIAKLRENDAAARLYPETYSQALNVLPEGFERGVASRWAFDVGITTSDLQTFVNDTRATLAGTPVPTDAVSDVDVADARALISRDSRLSDFLTKVGVANHPRVLTIFANLAREQRGRGRL